MSENKPSIYKVITNVMIAGGASMLLVMGLINQVLFVVGTSMFEFAPYFGSSYYVMLGCFAFFILGLILSLVNPVGDRRKPLVFCLLAMLMFAGAMCIYLTSLDFSGGLTSGLANLYMKIAIRALLILLGFIFVLIAFSSAKFECKKVWKIIFKITLFVMMVAALLLFLPVAGDMLFAFIFMIISLVQLICFYPIMISKHQ